MLRLYVYLQSLTRREEGQDLLEYALLIALIAIVAVGAVTAAGVKVDAIFTDIVAKLP
jgi:Flp pilus assembly pilin Flp